MTQKCVSAATQVFKCMDYDINKHSNGMELFAAKENDRILYEDDIVHGICATDGDSTASFKNDDYNETYDANAFNGRCGNHGIKNQNKRFNAKTNQHGRRVYAEMKIERKSLWTHDHNTALMKHFGAMSSTKLAFLCKKYNIYDKNEIDLHRDDITGSWRQIPHHLISADPEHSKCGEADKDFCGVRKMINGHFNINYKSENFLIKGEPTTLPTSAAANKVLLEEWDEYWQWELLKACILGSKTKGTQWVESFNHVRAMFTNKVLSIKDPLHYSGQASSAIIQWNEGPISIINKLKDFGIDITQQQQQAVNTIINKRRRNEKYSNLPSTKHKRKIKKNGLKKKEINNKDYISGGYLLEINKKKRKLSDDNNNHRRKRRKYSNNNNHNKNNKR